ncbi:MAG TPA: carbohydrate ABC transporter permease [Lachnospiraceae bacterium]|nr:carbohydrate ABC transporter permease [Lachnospiraceae bacterium]
MRQLKLKEENGFGLKLRRIICYVSLAFVTIMCLIWFYLLFINTTKTHNEIQIGFSALPGTNFINNWKNLLAGTLPLVSGLLNSFFVSTGCVVLSTYFSTMTAYAIYAYDFKFKKFMFTFILMIMMIPAQVTALGFLRLINDMNLKNSFIPLIVPSIAAPITFFYLKQYMQSALPMEIIEAARIDGSGEVKTFNTIVVPMMKPAIAVQAIFTFVGTWNNYFMPALLISDVKKKTLPILIAQLRSADWLKFDMGQVYMMIAFSIFPVVVVYLFLSKYIVQGIAMGSVKG